MLIIAFCPIGWLAGNIPIGEYLMYLGGTASPPTFRLPLGHACSPQSHPTAAMVAAIRESGGPNGLSLLDRHRALVGSHRPGNMASHDCFSWILEASAAQCTSSNAQWEQIPLLPSLLRQHFRLRGADFTKADEQNRDTSLSAKRRSAHRDTRQRHDTPAAW